MTHAHRVTWIIAGLLATGCGTPVGFADTVAPPADVIEAGDASIDVAMDSNARSDVTDGARDTQPDRAQPLDVLPADTQGETATDTGADVGLDTSVDGRSCSASGGVCVTSPDCCSGQCTLAGVCACSPVANGCRGDTDCCSGQCMGGLCACTPHFAPCATDPSCCSGTCDSTGMCGCGNTGTRCNDDPDCCGTLVCVRGLCGA